MLSSGGLMTSSTVLYLQSYSADYSRPLADELAALSTQHNKKHSRNVSTKIKITFITIYPCAKFSLARILSGFLLLVYAGG